jgi:hypothetical protein
MLSRALSLATVTLLAGCLAAGSAHAQATNLEAGKSPSQIFAGTCTICHKSPRGLLKTVPASSLPGFLRQHYTTSSDMASVLSSYLVSNGATDMRYQAKQAKDGKQDAKPEAKPAAAQPDAAPDHMDRFGRRQPRPPAAVQEAAKPDADGLTPQGEGARPGQKGKRLARPAETPDAKPADGQTPAAEAKPGGRQKLSKRGKPTDDPSKPEAVKGDEATKGGEPKEDAAKSESKTDTAKTDAKGESEKSDGAKPASEAKSESAKADAAKENAKESTKESAKESAKQSGESDSTPLRPDPVPPVTPAPPATAMAPASPPASSGSTPEPAASPSATASPVPPTPSPAPSAVTAAAPPPAAPPPATPTGPPVAPISQ